MNRIRRALRADESRKSRLHDGKGGLHLNWDLSKAALSTAARHVFGIYPRLPWLTYPAIEELTRLIPGRTVFEFGAGTSTQWFGQTAAQVISVENNMDWVLRLQSALATQSNVTLRHQADCEDFIGELTNYAPFDVYLIDCQSLQHYRITTEDLRISALEAAIKHGHPGSIYVVDNTDVNPRLDARIVELTGRCLVRRFAGWAPGILHPNETTIIYPADAQAPV